MPVPLRPGERPIGTTVLLSIKSVGIGFGSHTGSSWRTRGEPARPALDAHSIFLRGVGWGRCMVCLGVAGYIEAMSRLTSRKHIETVNQPWGLYGSSGCVLANQGPQLGEQKTSTEHQSKNCVRWYLRLSVSEVCWCFVGLNQSALGFPSYTHAVHKAVNVYE